MSDMIATMHVPTDRISLAPYQPSVPTQVRQLQQQNVPPALNSATPIYITRQNTKTNTTVTVQYVKNPSQPLAQVTAALQGPNQSLTASATNNATVPLALTVPRSSASFSISVSATSPTGSRSPVGAGNGLSRAITVS